MTLRQTGAGCAYVQHAMIKHRELIRMSLMSMMVYLYN